jgi:hypothetical protein
VSLSPESVSQLQIYAQLAVGFAGFAGVIGAFSRFRIHAQATAFRVRAMVGIALMEVVFSLLPPLISAFGATQADTWRISCGVLAGLSSILLVVLVRQASILYRVGRLFRRAAYVLALVAVMLIGPLYAVAAGALPDHAAAIYFAMLFFGMVMCAYHFTMLMAAIELDESDNPPAAEEAGVDPAA